MYLIDHVAELQFVNQLIYAIKRMYTHTITFYMVLFGHAGVGSTYEYPTPL